MRRRIGVCATLALLLLVVLLLLAPDGRADTPPPPAPPAGTSPVVVPLADIGPWPGVSRLIGYRGRVWFANSVKHRNHNSADIHSYDPVSGTVRYETHLFSQDAGDPAVFEGRLYWPFEDARLSTGRGEFMVGDGTEWEWRHLADVQTFHTHALHAMPGALYAATSAWRAVAQRSRDGGASWQVLYEHPTEPRRVSRITTLTALNGTVYAGLTARRQDGPKLLREADGTFVPVDGWPAGRSISALTTWRGHVYAAQRDDSTARAYRTDGMAIEPIRALDGRRVVDFASTPDALWAATAGNGTGALWRSTDGIAFVPVRRLAKAEPLDLLHYAGALYLGTMGPGDTGRLWGPAPPAPVGQVRDSPRALARTAAPIPDLAGALDALDRALADISRIGHEFAGILWPLGASRSPAVGEALSARLAGPFPDTSAALFGGTLEADATTIGRWFLLGAIAETGHGRVPPDLLATRFEAAPNRAEKYLEPAPAAMWAVARLRQDDPETIDALIRRLDRAEDPDWLTADVVGALTAVTGQRLGHDLDAWRAWWAQGGMR